MRELDLSEIVQLKLDNGQFIKEKHSKRIICLHHSAGWDNVRGMFDWWNSNKERVGTCVGINNKGVIYQAFSSAYYAWHINPWSRHNQLTMEQKFNRIPAADYEKHSVGLEICNWGGLQLRDGKFYAWPNNYGLQGKGITVPESKIQQYPSGWRGHRFYEMYTKAEIEAVRQLLVFWCDRYNIPKTFNGDKLFNVSVDALKGTPGIWGHASYRSDKSDIHPQPDMIKMLRQLQ
jgi:hypothetical protein